MSTHSFEQQLELAPTAVHASPAAPQDALPGAFAQLPPEQYPEQHEPGSPLQLFPVWTQSVPPEEQLWLRQLSEQQSAGTAQVWLFALHAAIAAQRNVPLESCAQLPVQHSGPDTHSLPVVVHVPASDETPAVPHMPLPAAPVPPTQVPLQQSPFCAQALPPDAHVPPSLPASFPPPGLPQLQPPANPTTNAKRKTPSRNIDRMSASSERCTKPYQRGSAGEPFCVLRSPIERH
jgi:hypothetical protein